MILASIYQATAIRAEPVFVAPAQKLRSFLLSIWAILQTSTWHKINILKCIYFYFFYTCSVYLQKIGTSCLILLNLEYFVASRQWLFFFQLPSKDDRHVRNHTYCIKTNICYFLWESINIVLSVLFANEAYFTIKENNNKEKSFYWGQLPFCQRKL